MKRKRVHTSEMTNSEAMSAGFEYAVHPPMKTVRKGRCCAIRTVPSVTAMTRSVRNVGDGLAYSPLDLSDKSELRGVGTRPH